MRPLQIFSSHGLTCPKMRLNTKIWACLGLLLVLIDPRQAKLSDQRLCADPNCSVLVGVGKTVLKYFASEDGMLSFANNKPVKIFSKGAGSNPDLWGVMIDGRRGYVNKAHIQEQRVYRKDLVHTVPTEVAGTNAVPFTTQEEDEKAKQEKEKPEAEVNREEKVEPFSVKEETHKELEELQTQQPAEGAPVPEVVASFPGDAAIPSSVPASHLSTPPISPSASHPTSLPASNIPHQPVMAEAPQDYEVIDGTTLYMDGSAPKINVAPSSDNTTPEAIKPTVTEQAAAQPTLASAASDDLVEIEGSVGEQNPLVEELDVASPSLAPPLHSPSVTQPGAAGEDEVKVQESTQVEGDANVEVPIPNTLAYEPPPQPSLDSDAINAARVKKEDDDEDSEEEVADYEDLEPAEDSEVIDPSDTTQDELEKNQAMIEEMRAKHVEEEQAKVQEKIKAVMAEIELKTAAELKEKEDKSKSSEGETINTDAVEEPEPFSVEPMTTPPPPTVKEGERNAASANVEELSQSENVHENEVEDETVDSQPAVNTDDQVEPVVDPEKLHNQAEQ